MFSASLFWNQDLLTTFIAQRFIYVFIAILTFLFVQPNKEDVEYALKWITMLTILAWVIGAINPFLIGITEEQLKNHSESDFGFYVAGIHFVVFYFYILVEKYIVKFSWSKFGYAVLVLFFIVIYQNRSMMLGAFLILFYSLLKFRTKYKGPMMVFLLSLISMIFVYTWDIWVELFDESQNQLADNDYNRWKALFYYLNDYSPNWFAYIFGNGTPSGGNSRLGNLMWDNMKKGIYASDLGMIGMWIDYGLIPIFVIYFALIKILREKMPLYLKFMSFHILVVPTIFHFWRNPGVSIFVLIFYLYAYHNVQNKNMKYAIINNNR